MPRTALAVGIAMVLSAPVLAADCNPFKWGKDDQVSNANYITPQSAMQVVKLVKKKWRNPSLGHHCLSGYAGLSAAHHGDADRRPRTT